MELERLISRAELEQSKLISRKGRAVVIKVRGGTELYRLVRRAGMPGLYVAELKGVEISNG